MRRLALDTMDVPAVQAWLEDWAAKGWYLENYGMYLAKFTPGERREGVRYRLQPVGSEGGVPDGDTRTAYQEMGWTYVCSTLIGRMTTEFHIWRCDDPDVPELDTDQTLREEAYQELLRRGRRDICLLTLLIAVMVVVMVWAVWDHPRQFLVEQYPSSSVLLLCCNCLLCLRVVSRSVRLIRFTRRLRSEEPAPQRLPWRRAQVRTLLFEGLYLLILLVMIGGLFHLNDSRPYLPVSQYGRQVPYVSLAELGTPVAGEAVAVDFHSVWTNSTWWMAQGSYEETAYFEAEYYDLRIPAMGANLETQLMGRWGIGDMSDRFEALPAPPGVDSVRLWRAENGSFQQLVLRRDGQVLSVVYRGEADLREHVDQYVEMLEKAE